MPSQLAAAILPYMQKMPYLTAAQKAAAVHFGHFPTHVGSTIAAITPTAPAFGAATPGQAPVSQPPVRQPTVQAPPAARTAQQDRRLRRNDAAATRMAQADAAPRTAPASPPSAPAPAPAVAQPPAPTPLPPQAATSAARTSAVPPATKVQGPPAPGFESVPAQPPAPTGSTNSQLNAITLAQASAPRTPAAPPGEAPPQAQPNTAQPAAPQPQQQIDPAVTRSLADIIHAIDVPESERQSSVVAVDLTEIAQMQAARRAERDAAAAAAEEKAKKAAAAKAKAEADAKAKRLAEEKKKAAEEKARLAANPSRNWLQVGTGANKGALAFTMRGLRRKYDTLEPQDAWTASWGRTNRLLVGPFSSFARARTLEEKLKAAGADAFAWKSDAGEVVERLPAK